MDWAQVLVVILSVILAIFLLLAVILVTMLIKISRQIKTVTNSAQRTAEHIEKTVMGVASLVSPAVIVRELTKMINKFKHRQKGE